MPWFKLDDKGWCHPKVMAVGNRAFGAWCRAGQWASQQMSDGFVTRSICHAIDQAPSVWRALVEAGLLHPCEGGYVIHDYLVYNPSREECIAKQAAQREGGRSGARARWDRSTHGSTYRSTHRSTNGLPHDQPMTKKMPRPDPYRSLSSRGGKPDDASPSVPDAESASPPPDSDRSRRAWQLWKSTYLGSKKRKYGPYVSSDRCASAIAKVAERARQSAAEVPSLSGAGNAWELEGKILDHWFKNYMRDDGHDGFLVEQRHAVHYILQSLPKYGLPSNLDVSSTDETHIHCATPGGVN